MAGREAEFSFRLRNILERLILSEAEDVLFILSVLFCKNIKLIICYKSQMFDNFHLWFLLLRVVSGSENRTAYAHTGGSVLNLPLLNQYRFLEIARHPHAQLKLLLRYFIFLYDFFLKLNQLKKGIIIPLSANCHQSLEPFLGSAYIRLGHFS